MMHLKHFTLSFFVILCAPNLSFASPSGVNSIRPQYEMNIVKNIAKVRPEDIKKGREPPCDVCLLSGPERSELCSKLLHNYIDLKHDYSSWRPAKMYSVARIDNKRSFIMKAIQCSIDPEIYIYAKKRPLEARPSHFGIVMLANDVPADKRRKLRRQRSRSLSDFLTKIESPTGSPSRRY